MAKHELQVWTRDGQKVWISYRLGENKGPSWLGRLVGWFAVVMWIMVVWLASVIVTAGSM